MFEKKKKRSKRSRFIRFVWAVLLIVYSAIGLLLGLSYLRVVRENTPIYPAPPERVEIRIDGWVLYMVGDNATPQSFRNVSVNVQVPTGTPGSGFEIKHAAPGTTDFAGSSFADTASTGCVWGYIEIEGYPHYDFEFGINNIDFGAIVQLQFIVDGDEIEPWTEILASEIKPALAPEPVIYSGCQPQNSQEQR
jgi:hypothetical protein